MQNYTEDKSIDDIYGKLCVKIFCGSPNLVETELNKFLNSTPITVENVLQSESSGNNEYSITVTIFYYAEKLSDFIHKNTVARQFAEDMYRYIEEYHGVTFDDILDIVDKKRNKEAPDTKEGAKN